jgi:putative transposase
MGPTPRSHRRIGRPGPPATGLSAPNDVWTADCTGHVHTGHGLDCSPLTVAEGFSRSLVGGHALGSTAVPAAQPGLTRRLKDCGGPRRLRTDTGVPCATKTRARLSRRSAWGVRRGLWPALLAPGGPQQHGRHARLHRTLNADTTRPPAASRAAQQRRVETGRAACHHDRPPAALARPTPASCARPSPRPRPESIPPRD